MFQQQPINALPGGQVPDLTKLIEGDIVDLGAAGRFMFNPEGRFVAVPATPQESTAASKIEQETVEPPTIISGEGVRDEVDEAMKFVDGLKKEPEVEQPVTEPPKEPEIGAFTKEEREALGIEVGADAIALKAQQDALEKDLAAITAQLDASQKALTAAQRSIIASIQSTFATRITQMEDLNRRSLASTKQFGISSGAFMRAGSFGGILTGVEAAGIQRVSVLEATRDGLIAEIELAIAEKDINRILDRRDKLEENLNTNKKELQELQKLALERNKVLEERKRLTMLSSIVDDLITGEEGEFTNRNQIFQELLKNGASINEAEKIMDIFSEEGTKGQIVELSDGTHILINPFTGDTIKNFGDRKPVGGGLTGSVVRDADTIMTPFSGFRLDDVPTKDGYKAAVGAELNRRKQIALERGDTVGVIRASAGGKDVDSSTIQSLEKTINVIHQVATLQKLVQDEATGPIIGTIRSNNPFDKKAQIIKAQLSAIVPNLARGVYGEVGVLTDNDVRIYSRTLPNLKSEDEVRDAVLGLTILSIQRSIENKFEINARAGRDVSAFEDMYLDIKNLADNLLAGIQPVTDEELDISNESKASRDRWDY